MAKRWIRRIVALGWCVAALSVPGTGVALEVPAPPIEQTLVVAGLDGRPGGRLVVAMAAEPRTFNPLVATDQNTLTLLSLLHADLVRIHRREQNTFNALARQVEVDATGRKYRIHMREGLRFSDGHPLTAEDVVFTFAVLLDEKVGASQRESLILGGRPIVARQVDRFTLDVELPLPYASAERLFDSIAILPAHRLRPLWERQELDRAWSLGTAPEEMAGLGPFRLKRHQSGQQIVLERNPFYWKVDAQGRRLPYLDEIVLLFVPDENARALRFAQGETHLTTALSAESFLALEAKVAARQADLELRDLGPGLVYHFLVFNLNPADAKTRPALARRQQAFRHRSFRRAVSLALDRAGMVRLVYRGKASALANHISPGNRLFPSTAEPEPRSVAKARTLLSEAGFRWDDQGKLLDPAGQVVELTVATNASNRERVQLATILQQDLGELGIEITVAPLEFRSLLDRIYESHDYDAALLGFGGGDPDPNSTLNIWRSNGGSHLWQLTGTALEPWERELDDLMAAQMVARDPTERRKLIERAQSLLSTEQPLILLVTPHVMVGAHRQLQGFDPALFDPITLWNVETLSWRASP